MVEGSANEREVDFFPRRIQTLPNFELPLDNATLDSEVQADLLVCYLFVNEERSICEITRLVLAIKPLLGHYSVGGVILDRRRPGRMDI